MKKGSEKTDKYQRAEKAVEHEGGGDIHNRRSTWNSPQKFRKLTGGIVDWGKNRDNPPCSAVEIGQNTEKSPGEQRRPVDTQTLLKDNQR